MVAHFHRNTQPKPDLPPIIVPHVKSTIVYLFSILSATPARIQMENLLNILAKAPANQQMKSQMISDLNAVFSQ